MAFADSNTFFIDIQSASTPTWRQGMSVNQWKELSGSALSLAPLMGLPRGSNQPQGKQDAWCGWHVDTRTSDVYSVGQGGHDDYHGNEVDRLRLTDNAPAWTQVAAPTVAANTGNDGTYPEYYVDGRPTSVHGYHTSIYIESLNRALRFPGASRSIGGEPTSRITAFNTQTATYDTSATWGGLAAPATISEAAIQAYAKHPTTEVVYVWFGNSKIARWNPGAPGSWTAIFEAPPNPAPRYTAAACDPTRGTAGQCFFLGGGQGGSMCRRYDIGTNTISTITLTGTDIQGSSGMGLAYVPALDQYIACTPGSGGSSVYAITPTTGTSWACAAISTTGGSSLPSVTGGSAPFTKFLYVPNLGGCIYGPKWGLNCFFLRLH